MKFSKFISVALVGCMIFAQASISFAAAAVSFSDVPLTHLNYDAITFMADHSLISGYPDGTFKPDQVVNRAEALKMIMGINDFNYYVDLDGPIFAGAASDSLPFKDVDKNAWYYNYVQEAYDNNLVEGYPDGSFKPEKTINTVEGVKILLNHTYLRVEDLVDMRVMANPFNDADKGQWYAPFAEYAKEKNILTADSKGNIYPSAGLTRGKLAEMIYRTYISNHQAFDYRGVSASYNESAKKYFVYKKGVKLAEISAPDSGDMGIGDVGSDESDIYIKKVTANNAYISVCATGFGGYIMYDFCHGDTYRVNLSTGKTDKINDVDSFSGAPLTNFMDVSADEKTVAWTANIEGTQRISTSIIEETLKGTDNKAGSWLVDEKWGQFGDVKFSPDGKKLAFAAIVGEPDNEETAVITIDIATGKQTVVSTTKGNVYHVAGWSDNNTVLYNH